MHPAPGTARQHAARHGDACFIDMRFFNMMHSSILGFGSVLVCLTVAVSFSLSITVAVIHVSGGGDNASFGIRKYWPKSDTKN